MKHGLLGGLHLVDTVAHQFGDDSGGRVTAQRPDASVAVRIGTDGKMEFSRPGKHNAEIRSQNRIGRCFERVVHFNGARAHTKHEVALAG